MEVERVAKKEKLVSEFRGEQAKNKTYRDLIKLCNLLGLEVIQGDGSSFKVINSSKEVVLQLHRKSNSKTFLVYEIKYIRKMLDHLGV